MPPKYDLNIVKMLAKDPSVKNDFALTSAIKPVITTFQLTHIQAGRFILRELELLESCNYSSTFCYDSKSKKVFDVYGKRVEGIPFYIKFCLEQGHGKFYIYIISFHPIEKNLQTQSETLIIYEGEDS